MALSDQSKEWLAKWMETFRNTASETSQQQMIHKGPSYVVGVLLEYQGFNELGRGWKTDIEAHQEEAEKYVAALIGLV